MIMYQLLLASSKCKTQLNCNYKYYKTGLQDFSETRGKQGIIITRFLYASFTQNTQHYTKILMFLWNFDLPSTHGISLHGTSVVFGTKQALTGVTLFSTAGVFCGSGIMFNGVSTRSMSLLAGTLVSKFFLTSGYNLVFLDRSFFVNGSLLRRRCLRFLLYICSSSIRTS